MMRVVETLCATRCPLLFFCGIIFIAQSTSFDVDNITVR
jgi:hypothetical protein